MLKEKTVNLLEKIATTSSTENIQEKLENFKRQENKTRKSKRIINTA
jgi:hypothetical protein